MTIRIEVTNPAEHQPNELRAVATFLNNLAADRETGRITDVPAYQALTVNNVSKVTASSAPAALAPEAPAAPLAPTPEASPVAPSASIPPAPPAADVPPAPLTGTGVTLDKAGLPWDGRIHSETKNQTADGTWRKKRGVDPDLVAEVEARLREIAAIPPAAPVVDSAPEVPPAPPVVDVPPAPPVADVPPAPPVAPAADAVVTVANVFKYCTEAEKAGNLTPEGRVAALAQHGFTSMVEIGTRPDLAGALLATLKEFSA